MIVFVCYTLYKKLIKYIRIRQAYFTLFQHCFYTFANVIFVTNISRKFLIIFILIHFYDVFSDDVRAI